MSLDLTFGTTPTCRVSCLSTLLASEKTFSLNGIQFPYMKFFLDIEKHFEQDFGEEDPRCQLKKSFCSATIVPGFPDKNEDYGYYKKTFRIFLKDKSFLKNKKIKDAEKFTRFEYCGFAITAWDLCSLVVYLLENTNIYSDDPRIPFLKKCFPDISVPKIEIPNYFDRTSTAVDHLLQAVRTYHVFDNISMWLLAIGAFVMLVGSLSLFFFLINPNYAFFPGTGIMIVGSVLKLCVTKKVLKLNVIKDRELPPLENAAGIGVIIDYTNFSPENDNNTFFWQNKILNAFDDHGFILNYFRKIKPGRYFGILSLEHELNVDVNGVLFLRYLKLEDVDKLVVPQDSRSICLYCTQFLSRQFEYLESRLKMQLKDSTFKFALIYLPQYKLVYKNSLRTLLELEDLWRNDKLQAFERIEYSSKEVDQILEKIPSLKEKEILVFGKKSEIHDNTMSTYSDEYSYYKVAIDPRFEEMKWGASHLNTANQLLLKMS